jgi:6-pyruvoyl-tetrahydropterin synthase
MHGHSFKVEIAIEGEVNPQIGWVYDHAEISKAMKPIMDRLDHSYLNEIEGLENPTIEYMAPGSGRSLHHNSPASARSSFTKRRTLAASSAASSDSSPPCLSSPNAKRSLSMM